MAFSDPLPWQLVDGIICVDKIQDVHADNPSGEDLDYCTVTMDSGDDIMLAVTVAELWEVFKGLRPS